MSLLLLLLWRWRRVLRIKCREWHAVAQADLAGDPLTLHQRQVVQYAIQTVTLRTQVAVPSIGACG